MSLDVFYVTDKNPNHDHGGGGCLCSVTGCGEGPYVVFHGTDMESIHSPLPVLCAPCARNAVEVLDVPEVD